MYEGNKSMQQESRVIKSNIINSNRVTVMQPIYIATYVGKMSYLKYIKLVSKC